MIVKEPQSYEEIKQRNFKGRTFDITQDNCRQLQLDIEWLIEEIKKLRQIIIEDVIK